MHLEESHPLEIQRISFGEASSKSPTLTSTHNYDTRLQQRQKNPGYQNTYRDYQSDTYSQTKYGEKDERDDRIKLEVELTSRLKKIEEMYLKQREDIQNTIHELHLKLDQRESHPRINENNELHQQNTRLNAQNIRIKKQLLSQQFQMRMIETQIQAVRQQDNTSRLREQIKIKEEYHRKAIKQLEEERQIQIDRLVKLFEQYLQQIQIHYKGIIKDNNIHVSQNIQSTLASLQRTFNYNKQKQINRIGLEFINHQTYEPNRVKRQRYQEPAHRVQDNSTQVIQRIKQQLNSLNRLKQKQIQSIRNAKDKYSYLDAETEYQKVYLGLIVEMESLRYNRIIHKSSLEEQAEIIQLKSEIKILNEQMRKPQNEDQSKLKKELVILKDYIKEQNESKIRFFTDLQRTKTSYQQIVSENSELKKEIEMLGSRIDGFKSSYKSSTQYRSLEITCNDLMGEVSRLKYQISQRANRISELERQIKQSVTPQQSALIALQEELKNKQLDQLKLFSEIQSLQNEISRLKVQKDEYIQLIKRLGSNIETQHQLKGILNKLEKQNIHLRSQNQMIKQSLTQQNIAKATNEACRMITEKYERQIHILKLTIDKMKQELIATQKMNGQLLQDLRIVNQHTKTKGVAVEHLWEVKNAEYENIMGQLKRIQTL